MPLIKWRLNKVWTECLNNIIKDFNDNNLLIINMSILNTKNYTDSEDSSDEMVSDKSIVKEEEKLS